MASKSWIEVPINQEVEGVPDDGYLPFYFPDEGAKLVFEFTQDSFLKVLSALINGAALTYPNEWLQVVWYFLRNVEYPVSLCDEIAAALLTCGDVQLALATLIGANETIQGALEDFVVSSEAINDYITNVFERLTPGQITGKIAGGDCDESVVAGRAIAIVERLDTNNTDALEILEIGTNDEERLAQIISAFPGFGILPLDEILDFGQDVLEDFAENYAAASTIERKDEFAEDIYCLMRESVDCSITWEQLFNFVKAKVPTAPFDIAVTIGDILQFVGDGDFNNDEIVFYGMMLLQLATITASSNFNGLTAPSISAVTRDASTSTQWEEWDDCLPEAWIIWDLGFGVGWGTILTQTAASITVEASNGGDGFYRMGIRRETGCRIIETIVTPNTPFNLYSCGEPPVQTTTPPAVGDEISQLSITHTSAFTFEMTW